jgi:hypothetical protein
VRAKKKRNKSHEASYIIVEVGGTSTFVTHDVTKVEVRWAETYLKLKSHAPKERGRLIPRTSAGLSAAQGQCGPWRARARPGLGPVGPGRGRGPGHGCTRARGSNFLSLIFFVFSVLLYVLHFSFGVSCCTHVLV